MQVTPIRAQRHVTFGTVLGLLGLGIVRVGVDVPLRKLPGGPSLA